jgi:hypothetical protein
MAERWGKFFNQAAQRYLAKYLTTYNMATQALAIDGVNAENIQTTGLAPVMLNGVLIPALPADAELDVSEDAVGDAVGTVVADGGGAYFLVLAKADGTLSVWKAGTPAALAANIALKIPAYDPTTYVAIGLIKVLPSGEAFTLCTTALTTIGSYIQLVGPVLPHPDNLEDIFKNQ